MLPERLLGLLDDAPSPPEPGDRLVRVALQADPETPRRFLRRAGDDASRWFFENGGSWTAGIGVAARVAVPPEAGAGRFDTVRERLATLDERVLAADDQAPPLRLVGGFAFHEQPEPDRAWSAFGAAHLAAPAVTLDHGADGTQLVGTARVPADAEPEPALEQAREALARAREALERDPPPGPREYQVPRPSDTTDAAAWRDAVEAALDAIEDEAFRKVVLARYVDLDAPTRPDPAVVLGNLRHHNPGTNLFLVEPTPGQAFLGAAPEILARVRGNTFTANAVAGSIERGDDDAEDDRLARKLAASEKDREEHQIVVDAMRRRLARVTDRVEVARETRVLRLSSIQHLERELFARVTADQSALDLVEAVHPTPAVCGHPRDPARAFLHEREPFERGWYAGPVGWVDVEGDGAFAPGLRSGVIDGDRWRLYAGAGIVDGSDPDREYEETDVKFRPVLDALGVRELQAGVPR